MQKRYIGILHAYLYLFFNQKICLYMSLYKSLFVCKYIILHRKNKKFNRSTCGYKGTDCK